jgi:hypothetical protein
VTPLLVGHPHRSLYDDLIEKSTIDINYYIEFDFALQTYIYGAYQAIVLHHWLVSKAVLHIFAAYHYV